MFPIPSTIEGKTFQLYKLEKELKPLGYTIGGGWEYDHGYFDYKMNEDNEYDYLRVPFVAIDGQLDSNGTMVKLARPFLLAHQYQEGVDDHVSIDTMTASFDQFSEPENPDAKVPEKYIEIGRSLVKELEAVLIDERDS